MKIMIMALILALLPLTAVHADLSTENAGDFSVGVFGLADKPIGAFSEYADLSAGGGCSVEWEPARGKPWGLIARVQGGAYFGTIDAVESFGFASALFGGRYLVPMSGKISFAPECSYGLWVNFLDGTPYADQAVQIVPLFRFVPNSVGYEFGPSLTCVFDAGGAMWMAGFRAGARMAIKK